MQFYTDAPPSLSRWDSLTALLQRPAETLKMPDRAEYLAMSPDMRRQFDVRRKAYVSGEMTVTTPQILNLIRATEAAMSQNLNAPIGRRGVLVTGPSTVGKTTSCFSLMRKVFVLYGQQHPELLRAGAIPVAYVEVPPSSTPKGVMQRFADFYGIEYMQRTPLNELKRLVVHAMRECSTQVVIVDELHNLTRRTGNSGESVDTLKDLSNESPATFVYVGIKLEENGLLAGARGDQIARRFSPIRMNSYEHVTKAEKKEWLGIVMAISRALPLFAHDPKDLGVQASWLHQRSGGNIGTLQSLLVQTVHKLIDQGKPENETITHQLLSEARLDVRADAAERLLLGARTSGITQSTKGSRRVA